MEKNKARIFATILMLSLFIFSSSLKSNLFSNFKNYQQSISSSSNDELGGSLLDVVAPDQSSSSSNLFDPPTETQNLIKDVDLNKIVEKVNQPVIEKPEPVKTNYAASSPTSPENGNTTSTNSTSTSSSEAPQLLRTNYGSPSTTTATNSTSEINKMQAVVLNNTDSGEIKKIATSYINNQTTTNTTASGSSPTDNNSTSTLNTNTTVTTESKTPQGTIHNLFYSFLKLFFSFKKRINNYKIFF